jgi:hypothetical protein
MEPWNNQSAKYFRFSKFNQHLSPWTRLFTSSNNLGGGGYLVANINDSMGLITPLYLYAPEEKVNSHRLYLGFEWVEK